MKRILFMVIILCASVAKGQVIVNLQLPPGGIVQKPQLWNMLLVNTGSGNINIHIELVMTDAQTGQRVLSAASSTIALAKGGSQVNAAKLSPIQYNALSPAYNIGPDPNGLLPIGRFLNCYRVMEHRADGIYEIARECDVLPVEPLSPPQLTMPYNGIATDTKTPQFSWLPPSPVNYFTALRYDVDIVEVYPAQSIADAIQKNVPVLRQVQVNGASLLYPLSAKALEYDKTYAWRVTATSSGTAAAQSETWTFKVKKFERIDSNRFAGLPYVKLSKDDHSGYAVSVNSLKFEYFNETSDTAWNISFYNLSQKSRRPLDVRMDTIRLRRGQNLVNLKLDKHSGFKEKNFYLMELKNSRGEIWRLRFEFRKKDR
jgi:hypothetical protein